MVIAFLSCLVSSMCLHTGLFSFVRCSIIVFVCMLFVCIQHIVFCSWWCYNHAMYMHACILCMSIGNGITHPKNVLIIL